MAVLCVLSPSSDSDPAHFKSLKKFDWRVYIWYTLKQVSKIIFQFIILTRKGRLEQMELKIDPNGIWYHGSNMVFSELREGSTITQWKELAEAFSHQPDRLSYDDNGKIYHNGTEKGYLYVIDEPIVVGVDVYQHPRTVMDENAEFLTKRPLKVRMIAEL